MKNISIQIVLLLLISSISFGMGNTALQDNGSSFGQTSVPCADREKQYYVDYVVGIISSSTNFDVMGPVADDIVIEEFPHLEKTVTQALDHLNKCSFEDGKPDNFFVSLLRIYDKSKKLEQVWYEASKETLREELIKLGAEQGEWDCTQAMNKIKEVTGIIK